MMNIGSYNKLLILIGIIVLSLDVLATGQISDKFHFEQKEYSLIGLKGDLINPSKFGMETEPSSSANWRGYFSEYTVKNKKLFLSKMTVNALPNSYVHINGVEPDLEATKDCFMSGDKEICTSDGAEYNNINLVIPFTGKVRLGADFQREFYVHMGHQKPSAFKRVLDLEFNKGSLTRVIDRSEEAKSIRGQFMRKYHNSTSEKAVESAFSLTMEELQ